MSSTCEHAALDVCDALLLRWHCPRHPREDLAHQVPEPDHIGRSLTCAAHGSLRCDDGGHTREGYTDSLDTMAMERWPYADSSLLRALETAFAGRLLLVLWQGAGQPIRWVDGGAPPGTMSGVRLAVQVDDEDGHCEGWSEWPVSEAVGSPCVALLLPGCWPRGEPQRSRCDAPVEATRVGECVSREVWLWRDIPF